MSERSICLLNDSFPPLIDGVANAVVNYASEITARHGSAVVVTPNYPDVHDEGYPFPVVRYPSLATTKLVGYRAGYPFSPKTAAALKNAKVELLHTHCPFVSMLMARSLRQSLDAPVVLTYHTKFDIEIAGAVRGRMVQEGAVYALARNIAAADEVWVVSHGAGENLRSLGYEGDYRVMENGVDLPKGRMSGEEIRTMTAGYDLPEDVPVFLFVGRLMWYKGAAVILDALKELDARGEDFRMVFIGSGAEEEEIRAAAAPLGKKCIFTGAVTQREGLRAWYCRADLFLFPSDYDTNGLVVREAAACSLASVLLKGSCAAEGVTDGVDGFLIEKSAAALASLLSRVMHEREMLRRVGEGAAQNIYISWADAVDRACERYEVVLDDHHCGRHPKRGQISDEFFRTQGELMEVFSQLREKERSLRERGAEAKDALLQRLDRYL